jgi:hypothetical protein
METTPSFNFDPQARGMVKLSPVQMLTIIGTIVGSTACVVGYGFRLESKIGEALTAAGEAQKRAVLAETSLRGEIDVVRNQVASIRESLTVSLVQISGSLGEIKGRLGIGDAPARR